MVLPGKFDVSSQGAASFSVPITVPPGTGGMAPSLSLAYASGGGNGLLGVGWHVEGLSAITRCPQTRAQDGSRVSVTYTATDRFCLDGQRLILISGTYGAAGSVYRTENEGFDNITAVGTAGTGPSYFTVQTKSGQTLEYGNSSTLAGASTVTTNADDVLTSTAPTVVSWLLDKVADASGNYMVVKYLSNPSSTPENTEVVPSEIDYTGNPGGTGTNTSNTYNAVVPYNKVTFVYANGTRPDIVPKYSNGSLIETTQLLTDIEAWSGTQSSPGSTEVNDYKLNYTTSPATGRSLLTSLQLCDAAGSNCLPARTFTYDSARQNTFTLKTSTLTTNYGAPPSNWYFIQGDFVNNGRTDFAVINGTTLNVYLSNGDGTFVEHSQTLSSSFGYSGWFEVVEGDFNGDGKADFALVRGWFPVSCNDAYCVLSNDGSIYSFLSNGDGSFTQAADQDLPIGSTLYPEASISTVLASKGTLMAPQGTQVTGDFIGNGLTDFAYISGNKLYELLSNGNGTFKGVASTLPVNFGSTPASNWTVVSGDFTGSGLTDFALIQGTSSGNTVYTYLSNGDGTFSQKSQTLYGDLGSPPTAAWTPITGDFNGDGLTDVIFVMGNGSASSPNQNMVYPLISKGDGTFIAEATQYAGGNVGAPPSNGWTVFPADFIGSGLGGAGFLGTSTIYELQSNGEFSGTYTGASPFMSPTVVLSNANFGNPPNKNWAVLPGNYDGSGTTDFAVLQNTTLDVYLNQNSQPDLLTLFSNGTGGSTSITYGTPAEGFTSSVAAPASAYTTGPFVNYYGGWSSSTCSTQSPAPAKAIDVAPAIPIVVSTSSSTGISTGNPYESNFAYSCLRTDINGRGLLGFAQQVVTDPQTSIVQTTNFLQNYPFIGLTSSQSKQYTGAEADAQTGVVLNNTVNTYSALTPSSATSPSSPTLPWNPAGTLAETAPQFPYLAQSVVTSNDLNGTALPSETTTYTYDSYGEATTITASKSDGSSQTTVNRYDADNITSPNWILGRLTQSAVTSTTP